MSVDNAVLSQLDQATRRVQAIAPLAPEALDLGAGYALQRQALALRVASGEQLSGWKIAFAGTAAQRRFGIDQPVYGGLTDQMRVQPNTAVALSRLIHPKLEIIAWGPESFSTRSSTPMWRTTSNVPERSVAKAIPRAGRIHR